MRYDPRNLPRGHKDLMVDIVQEIYMFQRILSQGSCLPPSSVNHRFVTYSGKLCIVLDHGNHMLEHNAGGLPCPHTSSYVRSVKRSLR